MADTITNDEYLKRNTIRLADHHQAHCDGEECNISLYPLRELLEKAGIVLTDEEKKHFF